MVNKMIRYGCNACSLNPYGCSVCTYFSTFGTSRAVWCCGGDPASEYARYAFLTASAESPDVLLSGTGALPLVPGMLSKGFSIDRDGNLTLLEQGLYQATYTINIPASAQVDGATIELLVNGAAVPGTQVSFSHNATEGAVTITGQGVFTGDYASVIELSSNAPLNFSGENAGDILATLLVTSL